MINKFVHSDSSTCKLKNNYNVVILYVTLDSSRMLYGKCVIIDIHLYISALEKDH